MSPKAIPVSARCPIRTAQDLLGGKWTLLIIYQLREGPLRFSDLKKRIPDISEKMLGQELKHLAISQLVLRSSQDGDSPKVTYLLTEAGRNALPVLESLNAFGKSYQRALESRPAE